MADRVETLLNDHPRVSVLCEGFPDPEGRCVVYWMQRAQRGKDNAALNLAIALGNALKKPVVTVFGLTANYPGAQERHYHFLIDGLIDADRDLADRGVKFVVRTGSPDRVLIEFATEVQLAIVIGDDNPLRVGREWRQAVARDLRVPFRCVDADVVVPSSLFPKEEYAARTIRPKIHRVWNDYLKPIPNIKANVLWPIDQETPKRVALNHQELIRSLNIGGVGRVENYRGGTREAELRLKLFIEERLPRYATDRNEPTPYVTSELSAHLHFGHIGPLTIALAALSSDAPRESVDVYLEELIVRRELAINYVWRNADYDRLEGCPEWALRTLAEHRSDHRPYLYSPDDLEAARTHDPLWNACQKEMTLTGRMHNYLRMYWAKKILEWTPDAATAFGIAVDLNDRYEMDGRDPNGYTGIAWAIGGKHDRPWPERPIFGTVRFMSYASTSKKFNSNAYVARVRSIEQGRLF